MGSLKLVFTDGKRQHLDIDMEGIALLGRGQCQSSDLRQIKQREVGTQAQHSTTVTQLGISAEATSRHTAPFLPLSSFLRLRGASRLVCISGPGDGST